MSNKFKLLTSLSAVVIMAVIAVSSIYAATSASLGITCRVSFTATNYVGKIQASVSGLEKIENDKSIVASYETANNHTTMLPTPIPNWVVSNTNTSDSIANAKIVVTNGIPSDVVYTFEISNSMSDPGKATFEISYDIATFELLAQEVTTHLGTDYGSALDDVTITYDSVSTKYKSGAIEIPSKSGTNYGSLKVILTFSVKVPEKCFTNKSIAITLHVERNNGTPTT